MSQEHIEKWEKFSFPPWLPVAAAVVIMTMVALAAGTSAKSLKNATEWRRHSTEVVLTGQAFENNLFTMQRGLRGYVTLGDTNALALFYSSAAIEPEQLKRLSDLTSGNPEEQRRLRNLGVAVTALLSFDHGSIGLYRREGFAGISKVDAAGQGRLISGRAYETLSRFMTEEQRLWDLRDASEQNQYRYAGRMLIIGSAVAAVLFLLATYMASRELAFRRRAETRLKDALLLQQAILNSADYGIVATDSKGVVKTFNAGAERLLGYAAAEVIGTATPMLWRDPVEAAEHAKKLSKEMGVPGTPLFDAMSKKVQTRAVDEGEWTFIRKDGSRFASLLVVSPFSDARGRVSGFVGIFRDITDRKKAEEEREKLIAELTKTLAEIKTLSGLIPICAWCKSVRSDTGYWQTVEQYVRSHSDADFSHGVCPQCAEKFKKEIFNANLKPARP